jgi:chemotaxis protein MotB
MNKNREVPIRIVYRRRGHGGGHHGGAWKVAFADFMTAMFALFLVLWLVNQSSDVKSAIAGYFQDPLGRASEFGSSILPGEGAQAATVRAMTQPDVLNLRRDRLMQMAERLRRELERVPELAGVREHIEIALTDDGLRIQLLEDSTGVFFETGRASPSERGRSILALLGRELGEVPNDVRIEGYTDARPYPGSSAYTNWELSADRANMARRILTANGLAPRQIAQIRGLADRELREPADPYSPCNRRITITVLLAERPSVPPPPSRGGGADAHTAAPRESGSTDSTAVAGLEGP